MENDVVTVVMLKLSRNLQWREWQDGGSGILAQRGSSYFETLASRHQRDP
jgi:hypothetical protein